MIAPQPEDTLQCQFEIGDPHVTEAVNWEVPSVHSGDAGLAVIVGVSGLGLTVPDRLPAVDAPQVLVAVTEI